MEQRIEQAQRTVEELIRDLVEERDQLRVQRNELQGVCNQYLERARAAERLWGQATAIERTNADAMGFLSRLLKLYAPGQAPAGELVGLCVQIEVVCAELATKAGEGRYAG